MLFSETGNNFISNIMYIYFDRAKRLEFKEKKMWI